MAISSKLLPTFEHNVDVISKWLTPKNNEKWGRTLHEQFSF